MKNAHPETTEMSALDRVHFIRLLLIASEALSPTRGYCSLAWRLRNG
jgi:hypothetical protein